MTFKTQDSKKGAKSFSLKSGAKAVLKNADFVAGQYVFKVSVNNFKYTVEAKHNGGNDATFAEAPVCASLKDDEADSDLAAVLEVFKEAEITAAVAVENMAPLGRTLTYISLYVESIFKAGGPAPGRPGVGFSRPLPGRDNSNASGGLLVVFRMWSPFTM